jgi:hypothetical protein
VAGGNGFFYCHNSMVMNDSNFDFSKTKLANT